MQQQLTQQQPPLVTAALNTSNITTDQIQQYLDENKSLILNILENQNSEKLSECAENQARLQRNLMYLAAIADSQSQTLSMYAQPGTNYKQHQQSHQMMAPQVITTQSSVQPQPAVQQENVLHSQLGLTSAGTSVANIGCRTVGDSLHGTSRVLSSGSAADQGTKLQKTDKGKRASHKLKNAEVEN